MDDRSENEFSYKEKLEELNECKFEKVALGTSPVVRHYHYRFTISNKTFCGNPVSQHAHKEIPRETMVCSQCRNLLSFAERNCSMPLREA